MTTEQERLQRIASDYPVSIIRPWQERIARELPGWQAYIRPLCTTIDGQPIWTLGRQFGSPDSGSVALSVNLAGKVQDAVIAQARNLEAEHINAETMP